MPASIDPRRRPSGLHSGLNSDRLVPSSFLGRIRAATRAASLGATLTALLGLLSGCADGQPGRALRIASGSTSMTLCSAAFVSRLDPARAFELEVTAAPGMGIVDPFLSYHVDTGAHEVKSTIAGMVETRALYRPGLGCTLVRATPLSAESWTPDSGRSIPPDPFPDLAAATARPASSPAISAAVDRAFADQGAGDPNTLAVVVVQHGRILAERYAPGIGPSTPLPGHSLSKSVIHALVGVLVRTRGLNADAPVNLPNWQSASDARARITANQLLAMDSGLPWDEYHGGFDQSTRMWFDEPDPAAYAETVDLDATPGTHWAYSNLGYAILSRLVRDAAGGTAASTRDWMQRALFDRLGMQHTEVTFDAADTPMGANGVLASARDWARFGLLYLHDGVIGQEAVLPAGWVARARTPTLDAGYGSGFWLNTTDAPHPLPGRWGMPHAPRETYFGRGYLGQFVAIVPSADLVVVRLGISYRGGGDIATVGRLVSDVIAASPS